MDKTAKQRPRHDAKPVSKTSAMPGKIDAGSGRLNQDRLRSAAFMAKSLSDGNRLRILLLIGGGRKSVSAIVEELELSQDRKSVV